MRASITYYLANPAPLWTLAFNRSLGAVRGRLRLTLFSLANGLLFRQDVADRASYREILERYLTSTSGFSAPMNSFPAVPLRQVH